MTRAARTAAAAPIALVALILLLGLAACVPGQPNTGLGSGGNDRALVPVESEEDRITAEVEQDIARTFSALTEDERTHYCTGMSSQPVGDYAKAWKQSALEDGPAEFAPYGDYAEYLLMDRCYAGGYVGAADQNPDPPSILEDPAAAADQCVIKGNVSFDTGERIYHVPGQEYYDETVINEDYGERWFCTEDDAVAAGWRKSHV